MSYTLSKTIHTPYVKTINDDVKFPLKMGPVKSQEHTVLCMTLYSFDVAGSEA